MQRKILIDIMMLLIKQKMPVIVLKSIVNEICVLVKDCGEVIDYYNYEEYEAHDMSGYSNGRFCCTVCDYSE